MTTEASTPQRVEVNPEHNWRCVWHRRCPEGPSSPMKPLTETMELDDGSTLRGWECVSCGVRCYAGLDTKYRVRSEPFTPSCGVCLSDPCDQDAHDEYDETVELSLLCDECGRHLPCRRHPLTDASGR